MILTHDLRKNAEKRSLAHERGLAAHVWAGDENEGSPLPQGDVIGDEVRPAQHEARVVAELDLKERSSAREAHGRPDAHHPGGKVRQ